MTGVKCPGPAPAPGAADLRFIGDDTTARRWARSLCGHLGPAADVRVVMRCPGDSGVWEPVLSGVDNKCSIPGEEMAP